MEKKHVRIAKKLMDENNIDLLEIKIDVWMHKLMRMGWMEWFLHLPYVQKVLDSRPLQDIEERVHPYLSTILPVVGWISVVSGVVGIFLFLVSLTGIGYAFSFGGFIGIRALLFIIINNLAFSLVNFFNGIGLIRAKAWTPFTSFLCLAAGIASFVVALIPSGFSESSSYGSVMGTFINLVLMLILFALVHKHRHDFTH